MSEQVFNNLEGNIKRLSLEERMTRMENVTKMFLGYMRGKESLRELENILSAAMELGGEVVGDITAFPTNLPKVNPSNYVERNDEETDYTEEEELPF